MRLQRVTRLLMVVLLAALVGVPAAQAAKYEQGKDYQLLSDPEPVEADGRVQVREFFSYICPHCFDFRPKLEAWLESKGDKVDLQRVPVSFGRDSWALLARAYYVEQVLGILDETHGALFNAIHVEGRQFNSKEDLADFFAEHGADRQQALDAFDSFAVDAKMRRAQRLVRDYRVTGTPSMGVAGRYAVTIGDTGSQEGMLDVVSYLVDEEEGAQ